MGDNRRIWVRLHGKSAAAGVFLAAVLCAGPAPAQEPGKTGSPVLVELFLSQACNMCPPAAALFPKIAARDDVVALSWHVDYWNMTTSENGRWVDPYSEAAYTKRQKRYNMNIRHRSSIYTPQVIVDGAAQTVGADENKISELIASAPKDRPAVKARLNGGEVTFEIGESEAGGNAYLVTFKKKAVTDVTSGKNAGKTFDEAHVVTGMEPLGLVRRRGAALTAPVPAEGEGCALIVEEPGQKGVVAAAYCPA